MILNKKKEIKRLAIFFLYDKDGVVDDYIPYMLNDLNKTIEINSVREILKFMKKSVDDFTGEAPQFDDITMLCVKYLGNEDNNNINSEGENY